MRRIINGKKYDTTTATEIASNAGGNGHSDFNWFEESLYRKKTGEYFLCGEGGPLSRYREDYPGGGWTYGSGIIPLSREDAMAWAEDVMGVGSFEREFGEIEE